MTAHRPAADAFFCNVLANLHLHLEHKVELEKLTETRDLRSSGL